MSTLTKTTCNLICMAIAFLLSTEIIFCNSGVQLMNPPDGSANQQLELTFTWSGELHGGTFELQISRDFLFNDVLADIRFLTNNQYPYRLENEGAYFWRVRNVIDDATAPGEWSEVFVFKTITAEMPMVDRPVKKDNGEKQLSIIPLMIPLDGSFTRAMARNDDGSSGLIFLQFPFNFFGVSYNSLYINNNGNVSFDYRYGTYNPVGFPSPYYRMIAPFWADVDTRSMWWNPTTSGEVWYRSEPHRFIVIWSDVGYYSYKVDKLNDFELIITDGTPDGGLPAGMHVCFNYGDMQWTTGDASRGVNGFGGYPATVGMNRGDGINYRQIGRFDKPGTDYDGAFGANDGVDWLDGRTIYFRNDYNPPEAICKDITLYIGQDGTVELLPADIDNGSHDNEGGIATWNVSPNHFDCSFVGQTIPVTLSITDENYNVARCVSLVTIADPPVVLCRDITVELDASGTASITTAMIDAGSTDICGIASYALSKYDFNCADVGENIVTLTVTDVYGQSSSCNAIVTVVDNINPAIDLTVSPSFLWPPNHKMATITATVNTSDNCPGYSFVLSGISSNEADNGLGDGDTENDIQGAILNTADLEFSLRKERSGTGTGRIYTITYVVTDASLNTTTATAEVEVPHEWLKEGMAEDISGTIVTLIPNPFSDRTTIGYRLEYNSVVTLEIADLLGNIVYSEPTKEMKAGTYSTEWFGVDKSGINLPSGIYYIRLNIGGVSNIIPVTIFR